MLIEKLPEGAEGVVLEEGVVKAKPGYKFVKKGNKVMVMKVGAGGSRSAGGSWTCECKGNGVCAAVIQDNKIDCARDDCPDGCTLSVIIRKAKTEIIRY